MDATELEIVATVCAQVPSAIVCLLSALAIHDIGTQQPPDVWNSLDRKARRPQLHDLPVRIVRARTVVDCFRYRNKLGLDIALEALRDALGRRLVAAADLVRTARPYVQAVLS